MKTVDLRKFFEDTLLTNKITFVIILFFIIITFLPAIGNTPSSENEYLHSLNILQGLPEILGKGNITNYQLAAILFNVTNEISARGTNVITTCERGPSSFPDVPPTHEFKDAVQKMSELGVISGSSDGSYGGDEPVNRYAAAEALYSFMQCVLNEVYKSDPNAPRKVSETGFAVDLAPTHKPKVNYLLDFGIMNLPEEEFFQGNENLTGDQAIYTIAQLLKSYNLQSTPSQSSVTQSLPNTAPPTPTLPRAGAVTITSNPSGATVYIDNNPAGTTPLINHSLVVGNYSLKLVLAEHENVDQRLEVTEGITEQSFTLSPIVKTGAVTITSNPSGATVYIDNNPVGTTPLNNHSLVVGSYSLKLVLAEHEDADQRLEVTEGITEQSFTLSPIVKTGAVTITSNPSGAAVYIDNNPVGTTPLNNHSLVVGNYSLKLVLAEHEDADQRLEVTEGITEQSFTLSPIVKTGAVTITSNPSGATVYIDNNPVGTTPLNNHSLVVGNYSLKLVLAEHEDADQRLEVTEGITEQNFTLSPIVETGAVTIISEPDEAKVYIDDSYIGQTPLNNYSLAIGNYDFKITLDGYEDLLERFRVEEGRVTKGNFKLVPKTEVGSITITTNPSNAEVYIDNEYIGQTPLENYSLEVGNYDLKVSLDNHEDESKPLLIEVGKLSRTNLELTPLTPIVETGAVTITSIPSDAEVYIDNEYIGQTPLENYSLEVGNYGLKVSLDNHEDESKPLLIEVGKLSRTNLELTPLTLVVETGAVTITSTPSDAEVYIDNEYIGQTPLENYSLEVGDHTFRMTLDDEDFTGVLKVEAGKTILVEESLGSDPLTDFREMSTELGGSSSGSTMPKSVESEFTDMMDELSEPAGSNSVNTTSESVESDSVSTVTELVRKAQQGGRVNIAAGRYVLDTPLTLSKDVELIGAGPDKTFIVSAAQEHVVKFEGSGRFIARGISFEHTGNEWAHVLYLTSKVLQIIQIDNCRFSGGIWNQNSNNSNGGVGLLISGYTEGTVKNNSFENNGLHGIEIVGEVQLNIERNTIRDNAQTGIAYAGNAGGTAIGNTIEGNGLHGIGVAGTAKPQLEQNNILLNINSGIAYIENASGVAVGNTIEENGGDGIYIASKSSILRIEDNNVYYNEGYGIFMESYNYGAPVENDLYSSLGTNLLTANQKGEIGPQD